MLSLLYLNWGILVRAELKLLKGENMSLIVSLMVSRILCIQTTDCLLCRTWYDTQRQCSSSQAPILQFFTL